MEKLEDIEEHKDQSDKPKKVNTKVYSWGNGKGGNLGNGSEDYEPLPYNVKQLNGKNIVKVQTGEWFTMALSSNGTLYGWGKSSRNRYGMKSEKDVIYTPTVIPLSIKVKTFACGYWHSIIVSTTGSVYTVGDNKKGNLGLGHTENVSEYTLIPDFENIEKVAAGSGFSLFVNTDGDLFSCGGKGLCGHPAKQGDVTKPLQIKSIEEEVTYIDWGVEHAAAVTKSGKLYTWGSNVFSQLGHGKEVAKNKIQYTPKVVSALDGVTVINASCSKGLKHCHTACVDSEGNAYFWGCGYKGKLGNCEDWDHKKDYDEITPYKIKFENVSRAISGGIHSSVVDNDGVLYTFGWGSHGRLGHQRYIDGKYTHLYKESQPKRVEFFDDVGRTIDYSSTYSSNVALIDCSKTKE